jgi:hypothetical protein
MGNAAAEAAKKLQDARPHWSKYIGAALEAERSTAGATSG